MKRGGKRWREEGEENLFIAVSVTGHQTRKTHDSKANPNNGSTPNTIKKIKREKSNINLKQKRRRRLNQKLSYIKSTAKQNTT